MEKPKRGYTDRLSSRPAVRRQVRASESPRIGGSQGRACARALSPSLRGFHLASHRRPQNKTSPKRINQWIRFGELSQGVDESRVIQGFPVPGPRPGPNRRPEPAPLTPHAPKRRALKQLTFCCLWGLLESRQISPWEHHSRSDPTRIRSGDSSRYFPQDMEPVESANLEWT